MSVHLLPAIFGGTDLCLEQPDAAAGNAEAPEKANVINRFDREAVDYRRTGALIYCDVVMFDTYLPLSLVFNQHSYYSVSEVLVFLSDIFHPTNWHYHSGRDAAVCHYISIQHPKITREKYCITLSCELETPKKIFFYWPKGATAMNFFRKSDIRQA
jgi:hypothetical protein